MSQILPYETGSHVPNDLTTDTGLINEDQAARLKCRLSRPPRAPVLGDVRAFLFGRVRGFF